jgi:hypothetical protein
MIVGLLGVPWAIWAGLCLCVAATYTVVWPRPRPPASARRSWRHLMLRWAHAMAWVVLAGSCLLRTTDWPGQPHAANALALLAVPLYAMFVVTLVTDRKLTN